MAVIEIDPNSNEGKELTKRVTEQIQKRKTDAKEKGLKSTEGVVVKVNGDYTGMDFD